MEFNDKQAIMDKINRLETMLDGFPSFKQQLQNMLYWWSGNGSPGAREYMQRLVTEERMEEIIRNTVRAVLEEEAAKKRDESTHRLRFIDVLMTLGMLTLVFIQLMQSFG